MNVFRCGKQILLILSFAMALGCSDAKFGSVSGKVTMDGAPLANVLVSYEPESGERGSASRTDENGEYRLIYTRDQVGALTGRHVVRISTYDELAFDGGTETVPEVIPAIYNMNSQLSANVERGENTIDFALESGGKIIEPNRDSPEEPTPEEPTPEESTPEESTPEESTPEESTPEESTPEESTPEESTPEESTPEESTPEESTPEESTPEESTPEESTPEESTPEESTPEESTPGESTPEQPEEESGR